MAYMENYNRWLDAVVADTTTYEELVAIKDNDKEIEDRFYKDLSFGTGGLRGVLGAGSNRMNVYTVRRATQGLANYINAHPVADKKGVAIAYDSRHFSDVFAKEAALVMAANGIKAYLFDALRPTPELSYAVRTLNCEAGIVITASHNPAEYNGYKVYGKDGGQITLEVAEGTIAEILKVDLFQDVKIGTEASAIESGLLEIIGEAIDKTYLEQVASLSIRKGIAKEVDGFKVIYTPLHGSGVNLVPRALKLNGFNDITLVEEQATPDGAFPTVKSPNPEEKEAFTIGIQMAEAMDADLLFGTDPDADRIGVVVKNNEGQYQVLTGNQIGALLTHYILTSKDVSSQDAVVKTIVTSDLGANIAKSLGVTVFETLTGFKFIGEKIKEFQRDKSHNFQFGYEESYGYLAGTFVRDKDAVIASSLIVEMAAYYKSMGQSLFDGLEAIYKSYGYYKDALQSFVFKGIEGAEKIKSTVEKFRDVDALTSQIEGIVSVEDYQSSLRTYVSDGHTEPIDLPEANVIKVHLANKSWFAVRPSGTEPKLKIYYSTTEATETQAAEAMIALQTSLKDFIG